MLGNNCECHGSLGMTIINYWPVCVTVGVERQRTLTAQWPGVPSIGQIVQLFTENSTSTVSFV